jgi:hypothetical protein
MVYALVFAALVNWLGKERPFTLPVDKWKEDARSSGLLNADLEGYFDFVRRAVDEQDAYLRGRLNSPTESAERRLIASLVLSHRSSLTPEDRFVANTNLLLTGNAYAMWREETEEFVCNVVAKSWRAVVEQQRFLLSSPSLSVPSILSAIQDNSTSGLRKAARVLVAAYVAVNIKFPPEVIGRISELAG